LKYGTLKLRLDVTRVFILFLCFLFLFVGSLLFIGSGKAQLYLQGVLGGFGCVNQLYLLLGNRNRLEFDQDGVRYMPYSIVYLKSRSVMWSEIRQFEWKQDQNSDEYNESLVMDLVSGKSVSINVSNLNAEVDEVKEEFRRFARLNNVREYYKFSL
jgi:hypothetical protein